MLLPFLPMTADPNSVWLVTREYAGIAEAGGVKNVACSLAEGLSRRGVAITVFIPRYGCVQQSGPRLFSTTVLVLGTEYRVSFIAAEMHGISIILIDADVFYEKDDVYVYSDRESRMVNGAVRGQGHNDMDCMNLVHQRAVLEYARIKETVPDVVHCQDAHTALLPAIARMDPVYRALFEPTAFAVTIHNAGPGYRQLVPGIDRAVQLTSLSREVLEPGMCNGNLEPFLLAAEHAGLTTVSPWYARELTSHRYGAMTEGLSAEFERRETRITGIVNGIDYHRYDPADTGCSLLPYAYDPITANFDGKYRARTLFVDRLEALADKASIVCHGSIEGNSHPVYFTYQGRIVWQKGLDDFIHAARDVISRLPQARFIVLGQGDPVLEELLVKTAHAYPGAFVFLQGYERSLARLSVAISDFLVLPSKFEPCGLEDYIGQIFGTIPVAHAVGGLQKIQDGKTGFLYHADISGNSATILADRLTSLARPVLETGGGGAAMVDEYRRMLENAAVHVQTHCNWDTIIGDHYMPFYREILSATC